MAVRLASDTIRILYAIQCMNKDSKHHAQFPMYKDNSFEMCKEKNARQTSSKSSTSSMHSGSSNSVRQKQHNTSSDNALAHKVHPNNRPLRNDVKQRTESNEIDDILAKWNVYKPKK